MPSLTWNRHMETNKRAVASAPGKILVAGEYAVLYGAQAVLIAVNRRAHASLVAESQKLSPFLAALRQSLVDHYGVRNDAVSAAANVRVDSQDLYGTDGTKYGLGSSAAVTVAATTLCLDAIGEHNPALIHRIAHQAHAQAQQARGVRGSGADIACSIFGGVITAQPGKKDGSLPTVKQLPFSPQVTWVAIWTGVAADTVTLVKQVEQFRGQMPKSHERLCSEIAETAANLAYALSRRDPTQTDKIIAAISRGGDAIMRLGQEAGITLYSKTHQDIHTIAERYGGAAKPTGAGAGDIAIAALPTPQAAQSFREDTRAHGLHIVDLQIALRGAQIDSNT